ncbi:PH domain-containing protein [uncultured Helcococcus sp.]|uniref:PH domain-containing protein n=1 Tax=uncultured Helcococcus sp. TaxID=1072508 RepID=UPI002605B05B|nr:PH domain-containing protein [uncultured Helcococcus sp.]
MKPYFIDDNEKILWQGKPHKFMYLFNGFSIFAFLFFIVWATIFIGVGKNFFMFSSEFRNLPAMSPDNMFGRSFSLFSLIPILIFVIVASAFIIIPIKRFIESFKVNYYITDLRIYIESGIIGRDIQSIEYKEINKLNVNVDLFGKIFNRGTIALTPDQSYSDGDRSYTVRGIRLIGVENPYELYKMIKNNSLDVTTDQQYPNAYRPDKNPGYNTRFDDK